MVTEAREHKSRENQKMQQNQQIQQWPKDNKCFTKTREHDIGANERRINNIMNQIKCCKDLCGFYCKVLWVLIKTKNWLQYTLWCSYNTFPNTFIIFWRQYDFSSLVLWWVRETRCDRCLNSTWLFQFLSLFYWNRNELLFVVCKTQVLSSDSVCGEEGI